MEQSKSVPFKERYSAILEEFGLNPSDLANRAGVGKTKTTPFFKYRTGEIKKPGRKALDVILNAIPELSQEFLYKGVGPIRKQNTVEPPQSYEIPELKAPGLDEEKIKLQIENGFLKDKIKELEGLVEYLKKDKDQLYTTYRPAVPLGANQAAEKNFKLLSNGSRGKRFSRFSSDADMWAYLTNLSNVRPVIS